MTNKTKYAIILVIAYSHTVYNLLLVHGLGVEGLALLRLSSDGTEVLDSHSLSSLGNGLYPLALLAHNAT